MTEPEQTPEPTRSGDQLVSDEPFQIGTQPIDGGWRIKINDAGTHYVDVLQMIYNYRIVLTPVATPLLIDKFWCYTGRSFLILLNVFAAAYAWNGDPATEPEGWNKNGQTGEYRESA